jgi:deazaflavin-dependent oxidoreductase (nitroreductase family)
VSDYNRRVLDQFRANGGVVDGFGSGLVIVHSIGARTGEPREFPVAALAEGGSWLIVASAGGAPKHPGWYFNLVEHPDVAIETPQGSVDVHAIELADEEWRAAFDRFVQRSASFAEYEKRAAPRRIPIFRLEPRG